MYRNVVVDTNYLRDPEVFRHLERSGQNRVAIPDAVLIELGRGEALRNFSDFLLPLERFRGQVLFLKSGPALLRVRPDPTNRQRRLIDSKLTKGFPKLCEKIRRAQRGESAAGKFFATIQRFDETGDDAGFAASIRRSLGTIQSTFPQSDIDKYRSGEPPSERFVKRIFQHIEAFVFDVPESYGVPIVEANQIFDTYIFRFALLYEVLALDAIEHGAIERLGDKRLTHDFRDTAILSAASFFDGFGTRDKRMLQRLKVSLLLLREMKLFAVGGHRSGN